MNQVTLLGRMTRDPDLIYTKNGTAVTRFILAVQRENIDKADFIPCICFGKIAENTAQFCKKGRQVLLSGRLEINIRKNQENNEIDSFTTVVATRIEFLAKPKSDNNLEQDNYQNEQYEQQRFQTTPEGWKNPSETVKNY